MNAKLIYHNMQEIAKPYHAYTDQIEAIARWIEAQFDYNPQKQEPIKMKFKDAPIGARFYFIGENAPKDVYVKIHAHDDGLVVKWNGNDVKSYQPHCCWLDEENGYDFDTEIELI